ncbi:hypothetical protein THIOSC15_1500010 [uncultured Thiomicrorhabdus sp.]
MFYLTFTSPKKQKSQLNKIVNWLLFKRIIEIIARRLRVQDEPNVRLACNLSE